MSVVPLRSNMVNLEAEQYVLGAMMIKGSMYDEVSRIISAEDFYTSTTRKFTGQLKRWPSGVSRGRRALLTKSWPRKA